ncbi:hypothetical protein CRV03_05870 [Arcobacter sp. F155]|uniref:ATP-binding protein n=1 Tax=Arcobacter sp. F155 TaxID=2044512 RepID=UPI00100B9397|nr:ATP-binding protein [Arcobacter sp. F155]RXJ77211.1 hypothetical protein CRV03_05870 [Arcobacter sp. F155]
MKKTIFITGIHGVGKSYYSSRVTGEYEHYTASTLIKEASLNNITNDSKRVNDLDENQRVLISSFRHLRKKSNKTFLFDGHLVLLDNNNKFQKISLDVFKAFEFTVILLLIDNEQEIYNRIVNRDQKNHFTVNQLYKMQELEIEHANYVSKELGIPLEILDLRKSQAEQLFIDRLSMYI